MLLTGVRYSHRITAESSRSRKWMACITTMNEGLHEVRGEIAFSGNTSLIRRVRLYATATGTSLSEVVSRALVALLHRGHPRG
jgi:hypothetical protein